MTIDRTALLLAAVLLPLPVVACSDGERSDPPPIDGGGAAGGGGDAPGGGGAAIVSPTPPAPPQLADWTCPAGWVAEPVLEGTPEETSICAAPPLPSDCAPGTMAVVGETTCQAIGDACPDTGWPQGLPATGVVYVAPGAAGDGSSATSPLGSIKAALDLAPAGGVVAIAKGTYAEALEIDADRTLWGACATDVVIEAAPDATAAISVIEPAQVTLRNLTIGGPRRGVTVSSGATVIASEIQVLGAADSAIWVEGTLEADHIFVAGTTAGSGTAGHGLDLVGGEATVARSSFQGNSGIGIYAAGGVLSLSDVLVRSTLAETTGKRGSGIRMVSSSKATVTRSMVTDSRHIGVSVTDGSELELVDSVVSATQGQQSDGYFGYGIAVSDGAVLEASQILVEGSRTGGIAAFDGTTVIEASDVVVRDTLPQDADENWGAGMAAIEGADVTVHRAIIHDSHGAGCESEGSGSRLELVDAVVRSTRSEASSTGRGHGIEADSGSEADLTRVLVDHNRTGGIVVDEATVSLSNVAVKNTLPRESDGAWGAGVILLAESHATIDACLITDSLVAGVLVAHESDAAITASEVTRIGAPTGVVDQEGMADGIVVAAATATLEAVRVTDCQRAGLLFADGAGSIASAGSSDNAIGLALQGAPQPSYDQASCDFDDNATPLAIDAGLTVPVVVF